jgi:Flp pilus assembly protein TadG
MGDHQLNKRNSGQGLVEFALILPILCLLAIGVAELGNAINAYIGVTTAAREGARLASRGNIYSSAQLLQVIEGQTQNLDLATYGSIIITVAKSDATGIVSYSTNRILGSSSSHFSLSTITPLYAQAIATTNHTYLSNERFVIVEVFYNCPTLIHFLWSSIPMYSYTTMRVSAAS